MKKTEVVPDVPLKPMEDDSGADIHLQSVEKPAVGCVNHKWSCSSWKPPTQTGSYQGTRPIERSPSYCGYFERNCGFHIGAVCFWRSLNSITWKKPVMRGLLKHCSPWGGMLEQFGKDCIPLEGPPTMAGYQCEGERPIDMKLYELTSTHFPQAPEICEGKRQRS